jgi:hypothetical protein
VINEADTSLISGIAKNLYLYLGRMKQHNPIDLDGKPLINVKGDIITHDKKVKMTYQNSAEGMNKLAMQGKAKELGSWGAEITIYYHINIIHALGFVKKEEAESALKEILNKYSNQVKGEVRTNKMEYDWAKHYAPTYSIIIKMKDDKEQAREQSAKHENFAFDPKSVTKDQLDRLAKSLKTICELYKDECEGGSVHPSEEFNDGEELKELANGVQDDRIKSILNNMAQCCEAECEGSAEHLCDWINDDDCHYMCDFMGIDRMEF